MQINYDSKNDLLYLRINDEKQEVINRRVSEDIVLDIGADDKLVGIEILDASRHVKMDKLLPVSYELSPQPSAMATVHEVSNQDYTTDKKGD